MTPTIPILNLKSKISYEYLLYKLVEWEIGQNGYSSIVEFNNNNNLNFTKLFVSPFFTCTANGSFDSLFDLFGPFYALDDGHNSSVALNALLMDRDLKNFQINKDLNFNFQPISDNSLSLVQVLENVKKSILENPVDGVRFEEVRLEAGGKTIVAAINNSIAALKKHAIDFINYTGEDIATISMQHDSWSIMFKQGGEIESPIPKELVREDIFVFTPIYGMVESC